MLPGLGRGEECTLSTNFIKEDDPPSKRGLAGRLKSQGITKVRLGEPNPAVLPRLLLLLSSETQKGLPQATGTGR